MLLNFKLAMTQLFKLGLIDPVCFGTNRVKNRYSICLIIVVCFANPYNIHVSIIGTVNPDDGQDSLTNKHNVLPSVKVYLFVPSRSIWAQCSSGRRLG